MSGDEWPTDPWGGGWGGTEDETTYTQGRLPGRTYVSKSFVIDRQTSRDYGQPARFVHKVFDPAGEPKLSSMGRNG